MLLCTGGSVCLNAADRGICDSPFTAEYFTAVAHDNLSWAELTSLPRNSLVYSFLDESAKAHLLADYEKARAAYEAGYLTAPINLGELRSASHGCRAFRSTWSAPHHPPTCGSRYLTSPWANLHCPSH